MTPCLPFLPPDHLGLKRFEERFNGHVVVTITFVGACIFRATYGWPQAEGLQLLLVIIGAILAAALTLEDTIFQ